MEVLMEDDVFFADLNRQISLLIMDDDEDPTLHSSSVSLQAPQLYFSPTGLLNVRTDPYLKPMKLQIGHLQAFPHQAIQHPLIHPAFFHREELRREIKGTGVFIPRSSQPRRKNRNGGKHPTKSSSRQSPSSRGVSQVTYNNTTTFSSNNSPQ